MSRTPPRIALSASVPAGIRTPAAGRQGWRRALHLAAAATAALVVSTSAVPGWGRDGHRVVCEIAWRQAAPATRVAVGEILRDDPTRTFAEACTWADEVRSAGTHDWTRPWHFIDARAADGPDMTTDCDDDGCAVSAVVRLVGGLRGGDADPRLGRAGALKMLAHIVGDLHQPLHAGRAGDRGGNTVEVIYDGRPTTLHRLWDTHILRAAGESWRQTAERLGKALPDGRAVDLDPMVWAEESHELARRHAYAVQEGARLGPDWARNRLPAVEARLAAAGVRLAALLDGTVGQDPARPQPPPFWVISRRGTTYHYPECAGARAIVVRNLVTYRVPPADRSLHRGCPR